MGIHCRWWIGATYRVAARVLGVEVVRVVLLVVVMPIVLKNHTNRKMVF